MTEADPRSGPRFGASAFAGTVPASAGRRVLVVRHGETAWSRAGRHTGRTDLPLEPEGRLQAQALGPAIAGEGLVLSEILTSPLARARETCRLAGLSAGAIVVDDLAEWDYGACEGRTRAEIQEQWPGWNLWRDGCPNGEVLADVARRAERVIARVRASQGDVAVFAHGHLLRVLAACWVGAPPELGARLVLGPARLSLLGYDRDAAAILRWNAPVAS